MECAWALRQPCQIGAAGLPDRARIGPTHPGIADDRDASAGSSERSQRHGLEEAEIEGEA
jgi:hypothetical protein